MQFPLEVWPESPFDPAALQPMPAHPDFETLVVRALEPARSASGALDGITHTARSLADRNLDAAYGATIGSIVGDARGNLDHAIVSQAPALVDAGENANAIRAGVLRFLPQSDLPITGTFVDMPPPPGSDSGGAPDQPPPAPSPAEQAQREAVREAIRGFYRTLLFREADAGGLELWFSQVWDHGQSIEWVRQQILGSDEYQQKHPNG